MANTVFLSHGLTRGSHEDQRQNRLCDEDNGLPCVSFVLTLKDGRIFESPRMFDDMQISRAWRKVEALMQRRTHTV